LRVNLKHQSRAFTFPCTIIYCGWSTYRLAHVFGKKVWIDACFTNTISILISEWRLTNANSSHSNVASVGVSALATAIGPGIKHRFRTNTFSGIATVKHFGRST